MKLLRSVLVVTTMFALSSAAFAQKGMVTCKDGTKSAGGRGACSSHGGIGALTKSATQADAKAMKSAEKTEKAAAKMEKKSDAAASKTAAHAMKAESKTEKKM